MHQIGQIPNLFFVFLRDCLFVYLFVCMFVLHRRRLLILPGGAETRNEKQLHTNFSKLSVKNAVWFFD